MDRYDEALAKARAGKSLEEIFPELKEREDERIRKAIIDALNSHGNSINLLSSRGYSMDDAISYLEKQKEQKPTPKFKIGDMIRDTNEQNPAEWSEEDEKMIDHLIEALPMWATGRIAMLPSQADEYVKRIKSLRPQPHWKPSEDQMEALESAVKLYKDTHFEIHHEKIVSLYEQLKKLK